VRPSHEPHDADPYSDRARLAEDDGPPLLPPDHAGAPYEPPARRRHGRWAIAILALVLACGSIVGAGALITRHETTNPTTQAAGSRVAPTPSAPSTPSTSDSGATLTLDQIAARVDPAIVDITTTLADGEGTAEGTGMVISSEGEILTNNHVIDGATAIAAQINGHGRSYSAKVVGYDVRHDVAVLQLKNASGLTTIPLGSSSNVASGDSIVALGNALGRGGTPAAAQGNVVALGQTITAASENGRRPQTLDGMIEIAAAIEPGDSGGPVVDSHGKVIAMTTAASRGMEVTSSSKVAFSIPIDTALDVAHQIEAGKTSGDVHVGDRALLGVRIEDPGNDSSSSTGAAVVAVENGSPAEGAGLTAGDVIISVNGKSVDTAEALMTALAQAHPGDAVRIGWVDTDGAHHTATAKLIAGSPA
jgi:S1-C subfamily serine protease